MSTMMQAAELTAMPDEYLSLRAAVAELCSRFPKDYWDECDRSSRYPEEFVAALSEGGWLGVLIPEEYGGGGQPLGVAAVVLESIARSGAVASSAHAQMYTMGTILRHGSEEQKKEYLPEIAAGNLRLQAFGVTEADAGSDTTRIRTSAVRDGDDYVVNGSKIYTSRFFHSDLMLLLVRTTPYEQVQRKTDGLSTLLVDLRDTGDQIKASKISVMNNHETAALFFDNLRVPVRNLIGEEGKGFRYILSGMNAERCLTTSEGLGTGFWFVEQASRYAGEREVFGRPIGMNQAIQLPLAQAYANLVAASHLRWAAVRIFESGGQPHFEANAAKLLASQASWQAANAAMDTFGGNGYATEYGIERVFREARLGLVAPVNNNIVLAQIAHGNLGMPKSY
ncbi:MAG: acyl-CoA dehydrogenase [Pseudonocardia sp. SCN 72-86]|nr:MAG: acyl-CoA dehydrogenase [Pseudonocardia sp. SCN 72-86]